MGVMNRFLNAMRLDTDDDDFYDEEFYDDEDDFEEEYVAPKSRRASSRSSSSGRSRDRESIDFYEEDYSTPARQPASQTKTASKITPMRSSKKSQTNETAPAMEVCVVKPNSFEDSRDITDILLSNRTVILNLEGLDLEVGQRIIDFSSGSCYAIRGNLQKISNYIFVITPPCVELSGDTLKMMNVFDASSLQADI